MTLFQIGSLSVFSYGSLIALGALASLLLMAFMGKRQGLPAGTVSWFAVLAIPLSLLLGRAGYCLANLKWVLERSPGFFFQFTKGGFLLYGGLAGGILAALWTARLVKQPAARLLDAAAAPAALLIAVGRLAEYTVGAGYGYCMEEWFDPWMEMSMISWEDPSLLYRFPFGVQDFYESWNFAIFLPEALTALAVMVILLAMKKRRTGAAAQLMLLAYACGQIIWESMRQDQVLRWGFIRVNQLLSLAVIVGVTACCWLRLSRDERRKTPLWLGLVKVAVCAGLVIVMEFALEQKISFLNWMRMDVCYGVMGLACLGMLLTALPFWRRAYPLEIK